MNRFFIFLLLLVSCRLSAQKMLQGGEWCAYRHTTTECLPGLPDGRSDSIDLTHAWITLDLSQAVSQLISGSCRWSFSVKAQQVAQLRFDLLGLQVDSVRMGQEMASFSQEGENLFITPPTTLSPSQIYEVEIFYHGAPQQDASGWGGFYFSGQYAFNLGVGFAADPHVYGRAWFPCFDNFEERSTYTFDIYTLPDRPAYCNGYLLNDETVAGGKRRRVWLLNQSIPSYLAGMASGPYTSYQSTVPGINNQIPVLIAATASDTANVRKSFLHLPQAVDMFENSFGAYKWPKIGYSLVPFNSGAMEHATNVAIGKAYINGTLQYETLWAHELSHHWWGDLATCATQEDMWLNEGWASYCEQLFREKVYGKAEYLKDVQANYLQVLEQAHIQDGMGYQAVSGVPHAITYGMHVYKKGAVVAHNLRTYLGDSLFFHGVRSALANREFQTWDSETFRDLLEQATGKDLHPFFENWVKSPGFVDFVLDSTQIHPGQSGGWGVTLFVRQKLRGAPAFYSNVPLEFTFVKNNYERVFRSATVSGENAQVQFQLDFEPAFVFVNTRTSLTQARGDGEKVLKTTNSVAFNDAKASLSFSSLGADSLLLRVEHHFAAPDNGPQANPLQYALTNRFWQVYGDFPSGFSAQVAVYYDGTGQLDQLDTELFQATSPSEDSIVLLYRPGAGYPWYEWWNYEIKTLGSTTDAKGQLRIKNLQAGQYTIGKGAKQVPAHEPQKALGGIRCAPNPAVSEVWVQTGAPFHRAILLNGKGAVLQDLRFEAVTEKHIPLNGLTAGHYWIQLFGSKEIGVVPIEKLH